MKDKMYFMGDLTLPFDCTVDYSEVAELVKDGVSVANLEGAILHNEGETHRYKWKDKFSVFSSRNVLKIIEDLKIKYVSLCNNHILDFKQPIEETEKILDENGVRHWGLKNHDCIKTEFNGKTLFLITFATYANEHSLNLFKPGKVIRHIKRLRKEHPESLIVVFPHWGVERFFYPEPGDRVLAHKMIDAGANLIVGHHPHVIQPIERYKGVDIVYSIGNFIFPQTRYGERINVFPEKALEEIIVEWDGERIKLHTLHFDEKANVLTVNPEYDLKEADGVFVNNPGYVAYLKTFLKNASLKDSIIKTRYSATTVGEYKTFLMRRALRTFRAALIKVGFYHPYKEI